MRSSARAVVHVLSSRLRRGRRAAWRPALGLFAALASPAAAEAMEFRVTGAHSGRYTVHATGAIVAGDAERLRAALAGAGNRRPHLSISSGGGGSCLGTQRAQWGVDRAVVV